MEQSEAEPGGPKVGCFLGEVETGGHSSGFELVKEVRGYGRRVDKRTARVLANIKISSEKQKIHLYAVTGKELGMPDGADCPLSGIHDLAHQHGFESSFPGEIAAHLSMRFNGIKPALVAPSATSPKFFIHGDKLSSVKADDGTTFASDDIVILAHPSPGHS